MKTDDRLRVHMGCGELLQSRWWVPRPAEVQPVKMRAGKPVAAPRRAVNVKHEVSCGQ